MPRPKARPVCHPARVGRYSSPVQSGYFASSGSTITNLPMEPLSMNLIRPLIFAKRVSSLPRPTFRPGFTRVPRCRMMMVPPGTTCPPNALKPSRWAFESRPFREVPCPFLCAIEFSVAPASHRLSRGQVALAISLFLLCSFLGSLLRSGFLLCLRLRVVLLCRSFCYLLRLRFFLRQVRSLEALSAESDLRNADGRKCLPVSAKLLVLLFAFVVENQDFCAAAFSYHLANDARVRLVPDLSFFAGNRHYWKLNLTVGPVQFLDSNHIAGRHPVLLSTGADNRVHTSASVKCRVKPALNGTSENRTLKCIPFGRTPGLPAGQLISCACCVPPRRFSSQGRRPQNGSASTVKLDYFIVRCGNRSNEMTFALRTPSILPFHSVTHHLSFRPPLCENSAGLSGGELTMLKRFLTVSL